jgi:hypothetical protein
VNLKKIFYKYSNLKKGGERMESIEKFLNEEIARIEYEIRISGKAVLVTFSNQDLKPLAINIARKFESKWSEKGSESSSIREGIDLVDGKFYITIMGIVNGRQFAVSKMLELD